MKKDVGLSLLSDKKENANRNSKFAMFVQNRLVYQRKESLAL